MLNFTRLNPKKRCGGFSLPETLITLSIIGVVFSLTAGVMIADYQRTYTAIRLKQVYAVIEQGFRRAAAFNYNTTAWTFPDAVTPDSTYEFFERYLKPQFHLSMDCKNSSESPCDYTFRYLNGVQEQLGNTYTRFYLNDGAFIAMEVNADSSGKQFINFYLDVNGKKRLNVAGRDVFKFTFWAANPDNPDLQGKLLPAGYDLSKDDLISGGGDSCSASGNGINCAALIMKDDWQIKQGYPWSQARYALAMEDDNS